MSVRQRVLQSAPLVAFALAVVFLGLSLGGYSPADPPGWGADPLNNPPANPCGPVGAIFAHILFISVGWSSWLLLLGLAVINVLLIAKRAVPDRLGPVVGFVITLVATAGFIHRLAPRLAPSPTVGTGGYIGATVAIFLEAYFHLTGMILILAAIGVFGLALCHEVLFVWPFQELRGWLLRRWRRRGSGLAHQGGAGSMIVLSDLPDRDHPAYAQASSSHPAPSLMAPGAAATGGDPGMRRLLPPVAAAVPQTAGNQGDTWRPHSNLARRSSCRPSRFLSLSVLFRCKSTRRR